MQNYNCKNCGAVLYWDVDEGCLKCQYCGSKYQPSEFEDLTDTTEEVKSEEAEKEYTNTEPAEDMSVYECKNCGGEIVTLKTTMATICPYCGEAVSITSKSAGEFRPELCIPFAKDKKEIMTLFSRYIHESPLTPRKFKEQHTIEKCQGLFTPFYLHTMDDQADYVFEGQRTSSRRSGDDLVTTHKIYELLLESKGTFIRLPTDGSLRIDNQMMEAIEPFDYDGCKPYNPAYMAGFAAEQVDDNKEDMLERAKQRAKSGMLKKAQTAFSSFSHVTLKRDHHDFQKLSSEYVMLPIWLLNVNYRGEKYTFAVNGQSGKVVGKLPMDKGKLALYGLCSFLISDVVITLVATIAKAFF